MKIYSYLAILIFAALSLIPPINFIIQNPPLEYWLWMVLVAGFLGISTLFIKTDLAVKVIAVGTFIHCFFSSIPYLSFTAYVVIVAACYFYVLCTKITDWEIVFKALQSIVILNGLILFMQVIGHDPLLNFGLFHMEHYGILGQHMQMTSFMVIIAAILFTVNKSYMSFAVICCLICNSSWSFICLGVGIAMSCLGFNKKVTVVLLLIVIVFSMGWMIKDRKIITNMSMETGRAAVWKRSIELSNQRPWAGWGAGTYKDLFPPLSNLKKSIPYRTAHNFIVQFIFEFGYPITGCLLFALGCLLYTLYIKKQWLLLSGASMMILDGLVHFPDRMIQAVPLIILFLAYIRFVMRRNSYGF